MTYKTATQQALFAPFVDEQVVAQAELEQHITQQAQSVAPEEFRVVEISCYDQEIYIGHAFGLGDRGRRGDSCDTPNHQLDYTCEAKVRKRTGLNRPDPKHLILLMMVSTTKM
ncbi:hypothetical protein NIES4106_58700 (plasmid) [Fischerella sp. NIES-4106]|nr:hypothetical protein NIES4106_58700 [Fischerella sp. NIES-4106]